MIQGNKKIYVICLIALLMTCDQLLAQTASRNSKNNRGVESKSAEEIQRLQWEIAFLKTRLDDLESGEAHIRLEDAAFDITRNRFGSFTVSCIAVNPFLDGFKVRFRLGNLTNATYNSFKLKFRWFTKDKADPNTKELSFTNNFYAGSFIDVEAPFTPATPGEFKEISVKILLNQMEMPHR